jgi:hypothetical protein
MGGYVPIIYDSAIKGFTINIPDKLILNSILSNPLVDFVERLVETDLLVPKNIKSI